MVEIADEYWDYYRGSAQLWNIDRGDVDQIEQWEDLSPTGVAARIGQLHRFAACADEMPAGELSDRERTMLAALSFSARSTALALPYARDLALVAGPFNFVTFLSVLVPGYGLVTMDHGDGYVTKLRSLPSFVDGWIAGLRGGAAAGRVATARGVAGAVAAYERLLGGDVAEDPLAGQPRRARPRTRPPGGPTVVDAMREAARPVVARFRDALRDEVLPYARADDQAGICHLPGGPDGYRVLLWASTSTDLTPAGVHELGIRQLALLDDEYRALGPGVVGVGEPVQVRELPPPWQASRDQRGARTCSSAPPPISGFG